MKRKYLGRFWNIVLPLTLTFIALEVVAVIFMDLLKHNGNLTSIGWLAAWVGFIVAFGFKVVWAIIRASDELAVK